METKQSFLMPTLPTIRKLQLYNLFIPASSPFLCCLYFFSFDHTIMTFGGLQH